MVSALPWRVSACVNHQASFSASTLRQRLQVQTSTQAFLTFLRRTSMDLNSSRRTSTRDGTSCKVSRRLVLAPIMLLVRVWRDRRRLVDQDPDFLEASRLAFKGWRSITNFLFVNVDRSRGGTIDEITMLRIGESGATSSASNLAWMYSQGLDGNELDAGSWLRDEGSWTDRIR